MPRPARQPDPTPDEIAAMAAAIKSEGLARKAQESHNFETPHMAKLRQAYVPRVYTIGRAK